MRSLVLISCLFSVLFLKAGNIDQPIARKVAENWYRHYAPPAKITSGISKTMEYKWNSRTACYLFSFDKGGFVIVSAHDASTPVLGYGFESNVPDSITNPALKEWLDACACRIDSLFLLNINTTQYSLQWEQLKNNMFLPNSGTSVSPMITTNWDQGCYYNESCPADPAGACGHVWVGCTATAMAQIMKYWNYPPGGIGQHEYYCKNHMQYGLISEYFNQTDYGWSGMPATVGSSDPEVATLMYHCGVSANMDYSVSGSGAFLSDALTGFKTYFDYSDSIVYLKRNTLPFTVWKDRLKAELDLGRPVLYEGYNASAGHAFVCDGYEANDYFHFNWGWSGSMNGYFSLDTLVMGFNYNQGAILGIVPANSPLTAQIKALSTAQPLQYRFIDYSKGNPVSWAWDFGDGTNSAEQNPVHTFPAEMNYMIRLIVEDQSTSDTVYLNFFAANSQFTNINGNFGWWGGFDTDWADYDHDQDYDVFNSQYWMGDKIVRIFRNEGQSNFTQIVPGLSLCEKFNWGDFNKDGQLDFLNMNKICLGQNGGFNMIHPEMTNSAAGWGDFDNDGVLELLAPVYPESGPAMKIFDYHYGHFIETSTGISNTVFSTFSAGDFDKDMDLDLVTNKGIYRNDNGQFTLILAFTGGSQFTSKITGWMDYDNDGNLDAMIDTRIYRNAGNSVFEELITNIPLSGTNEMQWGDMDNDGDPDFVYGSGCCGYHVAKLFRNNSNNSFSEVSCDLFGTSGRFGDMDHDGDLDIISGYHLLKNNSQITNEPPTPPSELSSVVLPGRSVHLSWNASIDDHTPQNVLSYDLFVSGSNGSVLSFPMADTATGYRYVAESGMVASETEWLLKNLDPGAWYYRVQAVDGAFIGSPFSDPDTFFILGCKIYPDNVQTTIPGLPGDTLKVIEYPVTTGRQWFCSYDGGATFVALSGAVNTAFVPNFSIAADILVICRSLIGDSLFSSNPVLIHNLFVPATGLTGSAGDHYVSLSWSSPSVASFTGYNLYRDGVLLASNLSQASFTDMNLVNNTVYHYQVTAIYPTGESGFSNTFDGTPHFVPFVELAGSGLPAGSGSTDAGDYNKDGFTDLLIAGSGADGVYKNNGNGTFTRVMGLPNLLLGSAKWGDYNNDSWLDFIVAGHNGMTYATNIYLNNGAGGFVMQAIPLPGYYRGSSEWGDYDNDGNLDLLLTGGGDPVYHNNGNGTFTLQPTGILPLGSCYGIWIDINNDGLSDVIESGENGGRQTKAYLNAGNGVFNEHPQFPIQPTFESTLDWGDFNKDGYQDFVLSGEYGRHVVKVFRGSVQGTFTELTDFSTLFGLSFGYGAVKFMDYNNDGFLDLLTSGMGENTRIFTNLGYGSFAQLQYGELMVIDSRAASCADMNNDGYTDLIVGGHLFMNKLGSDAFLPNSPPTAPVLVGAVANGNEITFTWHKATDAQTPSDGLSYNLVVRPQGGTGFIVSPGSDITSGLRKVAREGNMSRDTTFTLKNVQPGTYTWSVQAVDNACAGGPFAPWQTSNSNVPNNTIVANDTTENGEWKCYNSLETIVVAGNGGSFQVKSGGTAILIAGEKITCLPGTKVEPGGIFHGSIAPSGPWCITPPPSACFSPTPEQACPNQPVQFQPCPLPPGALISTEDWYFGDETNPAVPALHFVSPQTPASPVHIYTTPGAYGVRRVVNPGLASEASFFMWLIVETTPDAGFTWSNDPANQNQMFACSGQAVHFFNEPFPIPPPYCSSVHWLWDFGDPMTGAYNYSTLQNPSHLFMGPGNSFSVSLTVTLDTGFCSSTSVQTVFVRPPVPVDFTFADSVCLGQMASFQPDLSVMDPSTIATWNWDFGDGSPLVNNQTPVHIYTIPGIYTVSLSVTDTAGCSNSISKLIMIAPPPVAWFSAPPSACIGQQVLFMDFSYTSGTPIISWFWQFGDGAISNLQSPVHAFTAPGTYTVILEVINTDGCSSYYSAQVVIQPPPVASFTCSGGCVNEWIQFIDQSFPGVGPPIVSWSWDFGDGFFSSQMNPAHVYTLPGFYVVMLTVTNMNGCSNAYSAAVVVGQSPDASFAYSADPANQGQMLACAGHPVYFFNEPFPGPPPGGGTVQWMWDFDDPAAGPGNHSTLQNPSHIFMGPGNVYNVTLTVSINSSMCNSTTNTQMVFLRPAPPVDFTFADPVCLGQAASFQPDLSVMDPSTIATWSWDFGDLSVPVNNQSPVHIYPVPGMFMVTLSVTDTAGCSNSISKWITIIPPPVASFSVSSPACTGQPLLFTDFSYTSGTFITSWVWQFGDGTISNLQSPVHAYTNPGAYLVTLTVVDANGCSDSATVPLMVNSPPVANFSFSPGNGCDGESVSFTDQSLAGSGPAAIVSWNWSFDDPLSGGSNTSTEQNPMHVFSATGTYTVTLSVINSDGCTSSYSAQVVIGQKPVANFSAASGCSGHGIQFTDLSVSNGAPINSWNWNFGDGLFSAVSNPVHVFSLPGGYSVTLTVTNTLGCAKDTVKMVAVSPSPVPTITGMTSVAVNAMADYTTEPGMTNYQWFLSSGGMILNDELSNVLSVLWTTAGIHTISVNYTNSFGCGAAVPASIQVRVGRSPSGNNGTLADIGFKAQSAGDESPAHDLGSSGETMIDIFPNPTSGPITLEILNGPGEITMQVMVYNLTGSLVMEETLCCGKRHKLSLNGQAPGLYLVRVIQDNNTWVRRIIRE